MKYIKLLITTAIFFLTKSSFCQTADITEGCFPLTVTFTGTGTSPAWDFDDGTFSNLLNPTHTFTSAKAFVVEYSNSSGVVGTITINVYPKPDPTFTTDVNSGCSPLVVEFTNTSTAPTGVNITGISWVFGDGSGNTGSPVNHTYNNPGSFDVSVELSTNLASCNNTRVYDDAIIASAPPTVSFITNPSPALACDTPLTVAFNNTSTSASTLTYEWDLGNGNTSTNTNPPNQTYLSQGDFTVELTATDATGCVRSFQRVVSIGSPTTDFVVPDTVCLDIDYLINNTSSAGQYAWNFGANATPTTSTLTNPTVQFNTPGFHDITLTTSDIGGVCSSTKTVRIFVEEAIATFTTNPSYTCMPSMLVDFTPTVNNPSWSYNWFFGNGDISASATPSTTYVVEDTLIYSINDARYFTTTLQVTTGAGCTASFTSADTIHRPNALLLPDIVDGCVPLTVNFSDLSTSNEPITSWNWVYGDGNNTVAANGSAQAHTYTNIGEYWAYLIIENDQGCIDTSYSILIKVGDAIVPNFSVDLTDICAGETVQFTDLTAGALADSIDSWHYYTEGDRSSHCFQEANPSWTYRDETGAMDVTLTVGFNGCFSSVTMPGMINVKGPIAKIDYTYSCDQPFEINFADSSESTTSVVWSFGDASTSTSADPIHTYGATGDYEVILRAINGGTGCPDSRDTVEVNIRNIEASFISDTLLCQDAPYTFNASASSDVDANCNKGYTWYFSDPDSRPITTGNALEDIPFPATGTNEVTLVVTDVNGCTDTVSDFVRVYGTTSQFDIDKPTICIPSEVTFDDTSISDTTITNWSWSFGDGQTYSGQDTSHTYTTHTTMFDVELVITNAIGCKDSIEQTIPVYVPTSTITSTPAVTDICAGDTVYFSATDFTTQGSNLSFAWDFKDGNMSTNQNPSHPFSSSGSYSVTTTFEEVATGCKDSVTSTVNVQDYPNAGFFTDVDTFAVLCYPQQVLFTDTTQASSPYTLTWYDGISTFGANNTFNITYPKGTYTGSLIAATTFGCRDTSEKEFIVVGPEGDFIMNKDTICRAEEIIFTIIDSTDISSYTWDFGDGTTDDDISPITHTYPFVPPSGQTIVKLIMRSEDNQCPVSVEYPVNIYEVVADFERNNGGDTAICFDVYPLVNTSQNADEWFWDFGDDSTSTLEEPGDYTFPGPGTYQVTLGVRQTTLGCTDTIVKDIVLYPIPEVEAVGDTICENDFGSLNIINPDPLYTYNWTAEPEALIVDSTATSTTAQPFITTYFYATVTDSNACSDVDTTFIHVFNAIDIPDFDTLIVVGDSLTLPLDINAGLYNLIWTPEEGLTCIDCAFPRAQPLEDIVYELFITDILDCFSANIVYDIDIRPETFVKLPTTFTPNGDGNNDIVYAKGWGIKELLDYRIYNRWGELVFQTNDIDKGWDGYHNGELQNNDVYVYQVKVITWREEEKILEGHINLVR